MRKNQNGTTTVDRTCTHCKEVYQRHLAPYVRVYEYDVCSGCAFAAWVIEQSHKTVSRVLH